MVGDALKGLPSLSCLNGLDWSKSVIAGGLAQLNLKGKSIGPDGAGVLMAFLDRSFMTLTSLDVR